MNLTENMRVGLTGLSSHKLRSILTALGIIFGVAAVIAMLSIGEGARQEALEQIRLMGVNNIIVRIKEVTAQSFDRSKASFSTGLTLLDAEAIGEVCPQVDYVVPQWEKTAMVQYRSDRKDFKVIGTTPSYLDAFGYAVEDGSFFQDDHVRDQANVCVIGGDVRRQLFHYQNPIGQEVKIDHQWFTVIGVMRSQSTPGKKVEGLEIRTLNQDIYIPLTTAQYKLERYAGGSGSTTIFAGAGMMMTSGSRTPVPRQLLDQLTVKAVSEEWIDEVSAVVDRILARRHFGVSDYEIIVPEALLQQSQRTQQIFNVVMGAIAGISLLVGGIGIMNIMLASVMERTKEIGIRRAVGASRGDVLGQFLFEAVFLSVVGGLLGIALGYGLTMVITLYAEWRTVVSIPAVILAFSVSAMVGIAFGFYPARQAAIQNPIESLRYE